MAHEITNVEMPKHQVRLPMDSPQGKSKGLSALQTSNNHQPKTNKTMNATIKLEKISPTRAKEILQNVFDGQRHIFQPYVNSYAIDMKEGRWRLGNDALLIVKGLLANGQHRLLAVIKSNITCPFFVMESNDEQLYQVIDSGKKRSVGDVFARTKNSKIMAAIGALVAKYKAGGITANATQGGEKSGCGRADVISFIEKNELRLAECADFVLCLYRKKRIMNATRAGALLYLGSEKNREKTELFITNVFLGESKNDAAWDYRERCIKEMQDVPRPLPPQTMFGLGIKALKSFLNGTRPSVLKLCSGEEFPKL